MRVVPPWIQWTWRRPRAPSRGCYPPLPLVGERKDQPPPPPPPPDRGGPSSTEPPRSARGPGAWQSVGLESSGPNAEEGRVPSVLGGALHRRAGGPEFGRAWEAGRGPP